MAADKMNLAFAVRMDAARTEANGIRCPLFPRICIFLAVG